MNKLSNRQKAIGWMAAVWAAVTAVTSLVALSPKTITCTGTVSSPQVYDLGGAEFSSLVIEGSYCTVQNFTVRGSVSHGVKIGKWVYAPSITHHVTVRNFKIYDSTTEGLDGGSWGSCLKIETNAHDIVITDGLVERCGGEAVGITGAENVRIERVDVIDGKQAGFYIDNSLSVQLYDTSATCTGNSTYFRNGKPSTSYLLGDEDYAQTLHASKLGTIVIQGAESFGCGAISYWGGQVTPNGVAGLTFEGVFWNSYNRSWIASGARNTAIVINAIYKSGTVATPTPASTVTLPSVTPVTPARTPTQTKTPLPTWTPSKTLTPTMTGTATGAAGCVPGYRAVSLTVQINTYPKSINLRDNHSASARAVGNLYADPGLRHTITSIWTDCVDYWASLNDGHWFVLKLNGVWFSDWRP